MTDANGSPIRTAWNENAETRRQSAAIVGGGGRIPASSFTKPIIWLALEAPAVRQVLSERAESPAQVQQPERVPLAQVPQVRCWTLPWRMGLRVWFQRFSFYTPQGWRGR